MNPKLLILIGVLATTLVRAEDGSIVDYSGPATGTDLNTFLRMAEGANSQGPAGKVTPGGQDVAAPSRAAAAVKNSGAAEATRPSDTIDTNRSSGQSTGTPGRRSN